MERVIFMKSSFAPEKTFAIIVGISSYSSSAISDLQYSSNDARLLYNYLYTTGGYLAENIFILQDREVNRTAINQLYLKLSARMDKDSTLVFFFSGHGCINDNEEFYLPMFGYMPSDTDTYFSEEEIVGLFQNIIAKKVLFLFDCCNAGVLARKDGAEDDLMDNSSKEGLSNELINRLIGADENISRVLITSSLPGQSSWESGDLGKGIFMHCMLEGLSSGSALNSGGTVLLFDIASYLMEKVPI